MLSSIPFEPTSSIHSITRPVNTYWAGMHHSSLKPVKVKVLVTKSCLALCDSMDCSLPGSSIHGTLQQEYWSGVSFHPPEDLPAPGIKPRSPALQADSLPSEPHGSQRRVLIPVYSLSSFTSTSKLLNLSSIQFAHL